MSPTGNLSSRSTHAGFFYGYAVTAAASISMALIFSVHYAFGVFFKPLMQEFGWTRAMTAGAFSLVWLAQGIVGIVMGGLNDKFGPRIVLSMGAVMIGGGYLLTSQTTALWQLYVFYGCLVGAGLGTTFVPMTSTTARWFIRRRGLMTGIVTSGIGVGALVGPPLANWIISHYNWRTSYFALGVIVLVGVFFAAQFLRKNPSEMGLSPYGSEDTQTLPTKSKVDVLGLTLQQALGRPVFWLVSLVFFCYGYMWTAILLHLAPHATDLGYSAASAAQLIAFVGAGSILGKVLLGIVADRIGNKRVYLLSFALMAASLLWLIFMSQLWALYMFALVFGAAYGGLATAHSPLVAWLFGMRKHGLIFGVCFNGFTLGCAVGPIVAGRIFDLTNSYHLAFIICCAMAITGMLLTFSLSPAVLDANLVEPAK